MGSPKQPPDPDDLALFRAAMANVKPLKKGNRRAPEKAPKKIPRRTRIQVDVPTPLRIDDVVPVESGDLMSFARSGIQPGVIRKMRRGTVVIAATLDLHGHTGAAAQTALREFLIHCARLRLKFVRIVHGKGRGIKGAPPVIKSIVNHWLREQPAVLAFCSAAPRDGGVGAVVVLLKSHAD